GAVISATTYDAGRVKMAAQKDCDGVTRLNIKPAFFLAGESKLATAETFFQSVYKDSTSLMQANIFQNAVQRIYESRITGTEWYLMARKGKTVRVFFLNGVQTPYVEQKDGWDVDGTEMKVRIDAAAKAIDWRGMYKNPGA
ncbi:MAG: peptidase, partial [Phycisphaerales bacterium]